MTPAVSRSDNANYTSHCRARGRTHLILLFYRARMCHLDEMREKAPLSGSPQSDAVWDPHRKRFRWGQNEHALWGKGAIARKQMESRSFKRLSCSLARIATQERTKSYVTALRNGALTKQVAK